MFTGLIEEVGKIRKVSRQGQTMVLSIQAKSILSDCGLGDSIAVNGVCLTVTALDDAGFSADVMPETFRKTTLQGLNPGSPVNLERAMSAQGRFGGHLVQGHVDGIARIVGRTANENAVVFELAPEDPQVFEYIIAQGSITIDGISLTVIGVGTDHFSVSIIPHTLKMTVLASKTAGDRVNLECDLLGKYVKHLLAFNGMLPNSVVSSAGNARTLSADFLRDNGFM